MGTEYIDNLFPFLEGELRLDMSCYALAHLNVGLYYIEWSYDRFRDQRACTGRDHALRDRRLLLVL